LAVDKAHKLLLKTNSLNFKNNNVLSFTIDEKFASK
jgi:hypothetical protein